MADKVKFTEPATLRYIDGAWRNDDGDPVDMVSVIRCRDCRWFYRGGMGLKPCCANHVALVLTDSDGFCHHGEREKEEANEAD